MSANPKLPTKLRIHLPIALPEDWQPLPGVPATRADCVDGPRPCPYVSCRHHNWLLLQQDRAGNPKRGRQGETTFKASTMESCALDVAAHGATADEVGAVLGVDPTRVRQILATAIGKLKRAGVDVKEFLAAMREDNR